MNTVEFPGLGLSMHLSEIAIPLPFGSGGIRWYALIIMTGILLALMVCARETRRQGEDPDHLYNMVLWGLPISIIGARFYYVFFSWSEYRDNPLSALYIWEGGLAIYGGVIAAFLTAIIYCKRHQLCAWKFFDIGAYGFLIGQTIGRWGNFVNGEAFGGETLLPWRMVVNGQSVHPTFLYESLWNLALFLLIWLTRKKHDFIGRAFSLYLIGYGMGRFWIEGLRADSLMLGNLRISRLVSLLLLGVGIYLYAKKKRDFQRNNPEYME